MTGSLQVTRMLPGVHRVRARRAGQVSEYWYAWRGGPRILKAQAATDAALTREVERLAPLAIAEFEAGRRPGDQVTLYGLITRYLDIDANPAFARLAERTRRDRRKFLDKARDELGHMEIRALESRRARPFLIGWRDRRAATPKTADELLGALSTVLQWAVDRGELAANPVRDFPRIYRCDRADLVWEPRHLAIIAPHAAPELDHAVRLAALTGLRLGDLIQLPRSAVGDHAIVWQTGKSRGRKTIVIPITDPLRRLLDDIPERDSVTVLNSARKRPWTASGLESALRRAKLDAAEAARERTKDPKAKSGVEHLRFHDLRGTAATNFIRAGVPLADVATILGWQLGRVAEIARRYVTGEEIGKAIVATFRRNTKTGRKKAT